MMQFMPAVFVLPAIIRLGDINITFADRGINIYCSSSCLVWLVSYGVQIGESKWSAEFLFRIMIYTIHAFPVIG